MYCIITEAEIFEIKNIEVSSKNNEHKQICLLSKNGLYSINSLTKKKALTIPFTANNSVAIFKQIKKGQKYHVKFEYKGSHFIQEEYLYALNKIQNHKNALFGSLTFSNII